MKTIVRKQHLWVGLTSGLVVFIVAITGCLYAFQEEIQATTQPYRYVSPQPTPLLPPSRLRSIADSVLPHKQISSLVYHARGKAVKAVGGGLL